MKREELLRSEAYWVSKIQIDLFSQMERFMSENRLNRTGLAEKLGVTKGYVSQVLNGNFDHKLSKLVSLAMAIGKVPRVEFFDIEKFIREDRTGFLTTTQKVIVPISDQFINQPIDYEGSLGEEDEGPYFNTRDNTFSVANVEHQPLAFHNS